MVVGTTVDNRRRGEGRDLNRERYIRWSLDNKNPVEQGDIDWLYSQPEDDESQADFAVDKPSEIVEDSSVDLVQGDLDRDVVGKEESVLGSQPENDLKGEVDAISIYEAEKYGELSGHIQDFEQIVGKMKQRELEFRQTAEQRAQFNQGSASLGASDLVTRRGSMAEQVMKAEIDDYVSDLGQMASEIQEQYENIIDVELRKKVAQELQYFAEGVNSEKSKFQSDKIIENLLQRVLNHDTKRQVEAVRETRANRLFKEAVAARMREREAGPEISNQDQAVADTSEPVVTEEARDTILPDFPSADNIIAKSATEASQPVLADPSPDPISEDQQIKVDVAAGSKKEAPAEATTKLSTDDPTPAPEPLNWKPSELETPKDIPLPQPVGAPEGETEEIATDVVDQDQIEPPVLPVEPVEVDKELASELPEVKSPDPASVEPAITPITPETIAPVSAAEETIKPIESVSDVSDPAATKSVTAEKPVATVAQATAPAVPAKHQAEADFFPEKVQGGGLKGLLTSIGFLRQKGDQVNALDAEQLTKQSIAFHAKPEDPSKN